MATRRQYSGIRSRAKPFALWAGAAVFTLAFCPCFAQTPVESAALPKAVQLKFSLSEKDRAPVPFEIVHGHLLFKARISGVDVWALLDNGFTKTVIDTKFAGPPGPDAAPALQARTPAGSVELKHVPSVGIEVPGQFTFTDSFQLAEDLSNVSKIAGRPISLVIGKDVFENFLFLVSFSDRTFQVGASSVMNVPAPFKLNLPLGGKQLVLNNDRPQIDVVINGRPAALTVDLGDDAAIVLNDAAWNRLGLNDLAVFTNTSMGADGLVSPTRITVVDEVSVGPINGHQVPVDNHPVIPEDGDGTIGLGFFSAFNFAFDLKAHRIWLFPRPAPGGEPVQADHNQGISAH